MFLLKDEILRLIHNNDMISNLNPDNIGSISVDITADKFYFNGDKYDTLYLRPTEAAICQSIETINLPDDIIGFVSIRNRWLRKGLMIQAPVYHPGHKTKIAFTLLNISNKEICLENKDKIVQIMFYRLNNNAEPYHGVFSNETTQTAFGNTIDWNAFLDSASGKRTTSTL